MRQSISVLKTLPNLTATYAPCAVLDVDLARDVEDLQLRRTDGGVYNAAWVLVRDNGVPLGSVLLALTEAQTLLADDLVATLRNEVSPLLRERQLVREPCNDLPDVTVVVCTRDHPDGLSRCLISLANQQDHNFEVMVVDNAPRTERARTVVEDLQEHLPITYVLEPLAGLSRARNRSLVEATTEVVAWIDDDEVADPLWVRNLSKGFVDPKVTAVCGVMVPAELDTPAQLWFEQWGGHSKGRPFRRAVFSLACMSTRDTVYPLPPFGTGGNMALRRKAILDIGGFDEALGAGT